LFSILQTNAKRFGLDVEIFECGLADQEKQDTFSFYPHASVMSGRYARADDEKELVKSFLARKRVINPVATAAVVDDQLIDELLDERLKSESFVCNLKTISNVIREHNIERIDLLKIDVEKSERDVLSGISDDDWEKIRQLVIEVHDIDGRLDEITVML